MDLGIKKYVKNRYVKVYKLIKSNDNFLLYYYIVTLLLCVSRKKSKRITTKYSNSYELNDARLGTIDSK